MWAAEEVDFTTHNGALELKDRIEAFWRMRGFRDIGARVVHAGFHPTCRAARYEVQTEMRNGWPAKTPLTSHSEQVINNYELEASEAA